MREPAFAPGAVDSFSRRYPEDPALIDHGLADHPLLKLDALAALAERLAPIDVEYNKGALPIGIDPALTPSNGLGIAETIRSIEENGSWMVLKFIEKDSVYRALLHDVLDGLSGAVAPSTGEMLKREGFIFISSPGSVTPFHFDPEHNILMQIRGSKTMTVFPAADQEIASGELHEAFHAGAHRNLPWRDEFAPRGRRFELTPGKGLYVPVKAPHWVRNGAAVSISFSVTWRSEWSYHEEYAHGFNAMVRKLGLAPKPPRRHPHDNRLKSIAYRAARRLRGR